MCYVVLLKAEEDFCSVNFLASVKHSKWIEFSQVIELLRAVFKLSLIVCKQNLAEYQSCTIFIKATNTSVLNCCNVKANLT